MKGIKRQTDSQIGNECVIEKAGERGTERKERNIDSTEKEMLNYQGIKIFAR